MKRILTCSDIHGEIHKLYNVLYDANYNPKNDQLILLGDYIDRGPYSKETIEFVIDLVEGGAIALKGNHEDMFINALQNHSINDILDSYYNHKHLSLSLFEIEGDDLLLWLRNGGGDTIDSFNGDGSLMKKHALWMIEKLKLYHETHNYIFVHAGLEPDTPLEWQEEETMLWSRSTDPINLGKTVIHGHTRLDDIWSVNDHIFIDTGATYGGKLTLLELPTMKTYED